MTAARKPAPSRLIDDLLRVVPDGVAPPESIPAGIFAAAVDSYVSGQRLDMQALARRLGVSRATLYRHAGNREQVLDEVVWWRSRHALVAAMQHTDQLRGVPRLVGVVGGLMRAVERDRSLHTFLETDPEAALRILTGTRSAVQRGTSQALGALLELETERGNFHAELDTTTLAYAIVRIGEAFLYSDIIADRIPDVTQAITVVEALLHGLDSSC